SRSIDSFFFQAEDGIRDPLVTGVQTCALPIWRDFAVLGAALVRGFSCVFEGSVLRLNTFRAHAMRGRRIKALFEKLFDAHPIALERNLVAPRANPRETLQVMHSAYDPARRAGDDEPNRKHE